MANENEFVQKVRFEVEDGELHASIERFQKALGVAADKANGDVENGLEKSAASAGKAAQETGKIGREAGKAAKEAGKIAKETRNAEKETSKLEGTFSKLKGAVAGTVAAYMGFQGISKLVSFGKESVELYNTQMRQERMLQTVLNNKGLGSEMEGIKKHASEIQGRTLYGDEAMLAGAGELATYVNSGESMKRMMDLLANYAAGMTGGTEVTPQQMVDLATGLGKAFDGTYDAMRKKGFDTSELEELSKREKAGETITDDMKISALENSLKDWKGLAEVFANTDEGKIVQLKNEIGDVKEEVGRELLPVFAELAREIKANMPSIRKLFMSFGNVLKSLVRSLSDNVGTISTFANGIASLLNLFAQAPIATMGFVGALKFVVPMMDAAQKGTLAFGGSLSALGQNWQSFLKAGLFTATVWGIQKIWEAGNLLVDLANEKLREARREEAAGEIERAIKDRTSWQKSMKDYEAKMTPQEKELMKKMPSIPWNPGWEAAGGKGFDMRSVPAGATQNLIDWARAKGAYDYYQGQISQGQAKLNRNQSLPWNHKMGDGPNVDFKPADMSAEIEKAMQSVAQSAKGDTNVTNIQYTNNIKTDSDMMARLIKENLRTLLQSQLTFRSRAEGVKALAL